MFFKMTSKQFDFEDWKAKYPLCFKNEGCCILFGIECGIGWTEILHELLQKIENYLDANRDKFVDVEFPFRIDQVKEKFGTLRFYVSGADNQIFDWIIEAERKSGKTCEVCGNPGQVCVTQGGFWLKTVCEEHRMDRYVPYTEDGK
jgi:hypothetical protein